MPTENSVLVFSIFAYIVITFSIIIISRQELKTGCLKIDSQGIYNDFFLSTKKEIKWDEVESLRVIKINSNIYLGIYLVNSKIDGKWGLNYLASKINLLSLGTSHIINPAIYNCSFDELKDEINIRFKKGIQIP